jgi:hypothetical protein
MKFFSFSLQYTHPFPESGSGQLFHGSKIREIDSWPRKTPRSPVFQQKSEFFHFLFNTPTPSLNRGSIFKVQQSIPDLENPINFAKIFDITHKSWGNY